ncbi:hypothetical protein H072_989 [Dactylellina haptotyla CBS 200.50]|uniref:Peptidase S53 domain-containing protein n=1 Tax=Dactylellina haptotyla (strain CBS 200.50) TaxID=1284197 RepID=S8CBI4_DACHA|nr:hypothetical protein H072_989 [Dactylellina haptotyla CBS 200.50]
MLSIQRLINFPVGPKRALRATDSAFLNNPHFISKRARDDADPSCNDTITPQYLADLYRYSDYTPLFAPSNKLGVLGFNHQVAQKSDVAAFLAEYAPGKTDETSRCIVALGGTCLQRGKPGSEIVKSYETNLDVEYAMSASYPSNTILYQFGGALEINWLNWLLAQNDLPQTLSISFGISEKAYSKREAKKLCNRYAQLGTRGVSVLVASGDDGVGLEDDE